MAMESSFFAATPTGSITAIAPPGDRHHPPPQSLLDVSTRLLNHLQSLSREADRSNSAAAQSEPDIDQTFGQVVTEVLKSLYDDGIKPMLPDLYHRYQEALAQSGIICQTSKADLLTFVLGSPLFAVEWLQPENNPSGTRDPLVLLAAEPPDFQGWVDPRDPQDHFSPDTWSRFLAAVSALCTTSNCRRRSPDSTLMRYQFKGGRYGLAMELKTSFSWMGDLRLGDLCHMVQLAIKRGILCYEKSVLQPVAAGTNRTRAFLRNPDDTIPDENGAQLLNPKDAAHWVATFLATKPLGFELTELAKHLLKRHGVHLRPEPLGYEKVTDIFQSGALSEICRLWCNPRSRHKIFVQLRTFEAPAWVVPTDLVAKETPHPLGPEVWEFPRAMARLSFEFLEQRSVEPLFSRMASVPPGNPWSHCRN